MPNDVELQVVSDRTTTIRAALKEVEQALVIGVVLVVLVTSPSCARRAPASSPR